MEEENWKNKYQSNFDKFQKNISSNVVEIIGKNFWKIERMFPNNFRKVLGMFQKKGVKIWIMMKFHNYFTETVTKFRKKC